MACIFTAAAWFRASTIGVGLLWSMLVGFKLVLGGEPRREKSSVDKALEH